MTEVAKRIESLSPEQRRLLELRLRKRGKQPAKLTLIPRREKRDTAVLSFAQQRLWFLDQLEPGSPSYNIPTAIRIRGVLDVGALQRSLDEVIRRHESLRTTFRTSEGHALQVIAPEIVLPIEVVEMAETSPAEQESGLLRLAEEHAGRPFDLTRGPLLRVTLVRADERDHVLLVTMHHVISDGWSMSILVREMCTLYQAFANSLPSPLPPLPLQYADYASWQREWLQGPTLEAQRAYWKTQLATAPPTLDLPADRPSDPVPAAKSGTRSMRLSKELSKSLRELSQEQGTTLFMTLLAVFKLLLHRLTGQEDIVVGSPIAGRGHSQVEGLIGFFVNTLLLRTDLSGRPAFAALLKRVRDVTLSAYSHQEYPFEKLVEDLHPDRDLGRNPFFQVMFNLLNTPHTSLSTPGLSFEDAELTDTAAHFPLTCYVEDFDETLNFRLVFQASMFSSSRVDCMLDQYRHLLEQIVDAPERSIGSFSLLTPASRALLPDPSIALDVPTHAPVTETFMSWVRRTPDATAVSVDGSSRTYLELGERASEIAQVLVDQGLSRGDVVAVVGSRCFGLVAGMLGVLRAGGVMLLVDRNLPLERQRVMFAESRARSALLIGCEAMADPELDQDRFDVVRRIDRGCGRVIGEPARSEHARLPSVGPDDPAYIFFTSGSTGTPKGILGSHKGLSHFVAWERETFGVTSEDRVAQLIALSFDALLRDFFLPLVSGATLCLPPDDVDMGADQIVPWLERERITIFHTVPSIARTWLANAPRVSLGSLRWAFFAGEPLPEALVRRWRETFPDSGKIVNLYGSTETTLVKFYYVVPDEPLAGVQPAGWPLPQTQGLVLGDDGRLCGIGEPGEIFVRTPFRTLGYLNTPEENRLRFVANPFGNDPDDLLYRSGDRGRYRPDGSLEILGRFDHQVKIRGVRVELSEIEAALSKHPDLQGTAVIASEDVLGNKRLVAYVACSPQEQPTSGELRSFLRGMLPEYLIPSVFVTMAALPLTSSGKVDRRALPEPAQGPEDGDGSYVAPRTPDEELLAGIWQDVLGLDRVGVHDNFFDRGGHSLLATQVISRARTACQRELPLRILFETPTIAGLAGYIAAQRAESSGPVPQLVPVPRKGSVPLSFAQERLWILNQLDSESAAYNVFRAVRLKGELDLDLLRKSFNDLVSRHESLRTTFQAEDGVPVQVIGPHHSLDIPLHDLRCLIGEAQQDEIMRLADEESERPFDLTRGPLLRVTVLRLDDADHIMFLTFHHIITDGWSMWVFVREMALLYQAHAEGRPSPLQDLSIQYADFALWQRDYLRGETLKSHRSYWETQLAGAPGAIELPVDGTSQEDVGSKGGIRTLHLSAALSKSLRDLSRRHGATLFMTLLAAFKALLHRLTAQDDIVVGSPIAGRIRPEIENLIGFFVNTLVLRTDLSGRPTFVELLRRVREVTLGAYSHADYPFEKLVEDLHPDRDMGRNPFFQVLFNFISTPPHSLTLPALSLGFEELTEPPRRFPITFYALDFEEALSFRLVYQTSLFSSSRIESLLDQYHHLLEQIVESPELPVGALSLVTPAARRLLPDPARPLDEPAFEPVADMFYRWVDQAPASPAVSTGRAVWSYAALGRRATDIARRLAGSGLNRGDVVAIAGARSVGVVACMLGVLRAGGALLLVDKNLPVQRQRLMIREAQARHALFVGEVPLEASEFLSVQRVDEGDGCIRGEGSTVDASALPASCPDDPAYVFFTSGSTGTPKGVLGCQKGLSHFLAWQREMFAVGPQDRSAQLTALSFDVVLRDVLLPLVSGATLCIPPEDMDLGPDRIIPWLDSERITVLHTVPTLARTWLARAPEGVHPRALRWVFFAGEPLPESLVLRWRETFSGGGTIVNLYGPTETTLAKFSYAVPDEPAPDVQPVGWPLPETQGLVLGEGGVLCGIGEPGEIVIRTPFRSLGYLNAPEENQRRFFPNPCSGDPRDLLYRSGDRGRYRPDGSLEILGRLDFQAKIRGVRVELQEVEAALGRHPGVQAACVVAPEDAHGGRFLAAYIVPNGRTKIHRGELRRFLKEKLPEYMIPAVFVELEAMPLTSSGKVNRRALPPPEQLSSEVEEAFVAPCSHEEQVLAAIWGDVLGRERIGIHDNFFDLGGHSLLATQVVSRARSALQKEIPLRALFENPTIAGLAGVIAAGTQQSAAVAQIVPMPRDGNIPPSFAQERMWFLNQFDPGTAAYNTYRAVRLRGTLDVDILTRCVNEIVRRHEALRTVFVSIDGYPYQVVRPELHVSIPVQDIGAPDQENAVLRLAREESERPFDLEHGPLLRFALLRLGAADHVMLLTFHHIITDAWSSWTFVRELTLLYESYLEGMPSPLPELPVQYADFALWQRRWLQGEVLASHISYWKAKLRGAPPLLTLPTTHPRPAVQTFNGAHYTEVLPPSLMTALRDVSHRNGATLFMSLLSAFSVLLSKYAGQDDVLIGSPIANRNRSEIENLIGFFVNTLVFRADVSGDPTFTELLARVRETTMEGYAHQDVPFEKLVEELHPERDLSHPPLFQVMFIMQNVPRTSIALSGLTLDPLEIDNEASKFDLTLSVTESEQGLFASYEYNTDLFDAAAIERMAGHFRVLLESMAGRPESRISELPLMSGPEQERVLVEWNATRREYRREKCVHELFEEHAARSPEATAIVFQDQALTYAELDARANQVANYLMAFGAGPETLVGICIDRSLEMVVGLLGILKSGSAYVPLDPEYPKERLAYMIEDARVGVLLTQERLDSALPAHAATVVRLDSGWGDVARESTDKPAAHVDSESLAYVIYTSGSTGRPKGVQIPHRALTNFLVSMLVEPGLGKEDTLVAVTSLSFDIAALEIYLPLIAGGRIVLMSREVVGDGERLRDVLARSAATVMQATPATWRLLVDADWRAGDGFRALCGGEALPESLSAELQSRCGSVWNMYGPTETTVWSSIERCTDRKPTIGRPVANTTMYILDASLHPVPAGVFGELYIGGDGVARGYLNRPELTAEKFIPDQFRGIEGARLYRTGDSARFLADGTLEYAGRIDHQVKVRGFRIELGEIESVLGRHASVANVVAVVREDVPGDKRLVAYVVPRQDATVASGELREMLRESLPDYMMPAAFVMLDALPLTPNGKIDRRALPAPDQAAQDAGTTYVAPRTPHEEVLAGIWAEVLRREGIGVHDDFFDLGGHSLLATQVVSRVRAAFQKELPLRSLFESPTIAGLAARLTGDESDLAAGIPPLVPMPREGRIPLSFAQERMWFLNQFDPGTSAYNLYRAVRLRGTLDLALLEQCVNEIIDRHEALRTRFIPIDGYPFQVVPPASRLPVPLRDLRDLPEPERDTIVMELLKEESQRPFDLAGGPLVRVTAFRLGAEDHFLLLTFHHIASDAWSIWGFIREMSVLYQAHLEGRPSPLPDLSVQYADFALWQREWLRGEALASQVSYWREKLQGAPPLLTLPTTHPRPPMQTFNGSRHTTVLSPALMAALKDLSRRNGATLFMTLLSGFSALLSKYSGQDDVPVGSPIANRNRSEIENLIGFFVNTLVFRTDVSGDPTFTELLSRVRETTMEGYLYQDVPFEKLVEELQPERDLSHPPLFQVMFIMQNVPQTTVELPGLTLDLLEVGSAASKFDLTLSVTEAEEGLYASYEYNTDLFDAAAIERMAGHFRVLLESIANRPESRISELPLMTLPEQERVLVEWNDTGREYRRERCMHELFEEQAARSPEATAIVFQDQALTYGELDARANQVANYLSARGAGPETLVGICIDRSLEMVVGLLGILKSGSAYVPLDPEYPKERLAYMIEDARVGVLLTQERLDSVLPAHAATAVRLDSGWGDVARESTEKPAAHVDSESLAYVIYTSGSTGRPKGVQIPHRALTNFIESMLVEPGLRREDTLVAVTSLSFDIAALEIYLPLIAGGRVVLASREVATDGERLRDALTRSAGTVMQATPATWRLLVDAGWRAGDGFRALCGGEALPESLAVELQKRCGSVWNMYGPTETTVWSSIERCTDRKATIGRPVANTAMYILDASLHPVPAGVFGELYIGGDGVARGYLNRPELTAEKFMPDQFSGIEGARLYRTGDSARFLADGTIEYGGRIDHQVKVRGFRIELGEIESVLGRHASVANSVVVVREDVPGDKRLAAYVVPRQDAAVVIGELREMLRESLPDYMMPSAFVVMDALPLTPNGKIDRRALPAPDQAAQDAGTTYVAPRTPHEEVLAGIWAEVLRRERIGVHDDFFDLGGHSLLATQVVSRVRAAFQKELPLRSLFENPTIAGLAARLTGDQSNLAASIPPLLPMPREGRIPLSFAQERMWFLNQLDPETTAYNLYSAMRLTGALDLGILGKGLNEILRRHENLRTVFVSVDGHPCQVIAPELELELEFSDIAGLAEPDREKEARRLADIENNRPFDLIRGPLVRMKVLRLGPTEHILLAAMHHIITDGWSARVFIRELIELYRAFSEGLPSPLPELPIQYADFALWQRGWLQGEALDEQMSYWQRKLGGNPPVLELPADRSRSHTQGFQAAHESVTIPPAVVDALKKLSRLHGSSLYMTLLAGFEALLYRYTGQDDFLIGAPIANRNRADTENLIGFFLNTLIIRADLAGDPSFEELLERVRNVSLEAFAHQDLPLEQVLRVFPSDHQLTRTSPFQVMFLLQNIPPLDRAVSQLTITAVDTARGVDLGTAIFDLAMTVQERDGGLDASILYNAGLFDAVSITRMLDRYRSLLEGAAGAPSQRLSRLGLMNEVERQDLLARSIGPCDSDGAPLAHRMFEARVEVTPEQVAVLSEDRQLTYRDLNAEANRLARRLQALGAGPEVRVAICMPRCVEMIVAVLGVLKAGAAYVPIDPAYPVDRKELIISESGVSLILTTSSTTASLPILGIPSVPVDAEQDPAIAGSDSNLPCSVVPENLAYVIFTSGSTGRPKGVMSQHGSLANYTRIAGEAYDLRPGDRMLQFASLSFDASAEEIFPTLAQGATLVLRPDTMISSFSHFVEVCSELRLTHLDLPTAFWHELTRAIDTERLTLPSSLRVVILGGERALPDRLTMWRRNAPASVRLFNTYGPTESTIVATMHEVPLDAAEQDGLREMPIGGPIPRSHVYVMDPNLDLVPVGIPGELHIGGDGLARGYLNHPETTAERFVPNPFAVRPGDRLYKTGDLVRWRPDGAIEFLGRIDHQVKVRGFRVELGEVEAVLAQHPSLIGCAVTAREDSAGDRRLVAYVVAAQDRAPAPGELRAYLQERMPSYMVPSTIILLDSLPLTPSGKVDRRALPAPDRIRPDLESSFAAPTNEIEENLVEIWCDVLGLEQVGINDNFFELGGHSLLLPQVIHRVRETFQIDVPLRSLFEDPTIASLGLVIEERILDEIEGVTEDGVT
ncbi:MAG: non-ribosomal peptide synthase/polyketide synthase [Acidobacteriota bacterium]